ncbi:MAG: EAL domain-containing protein [Pseudomonadota bacterium]
MLQDKELRIRHLADSDILGVFSWDLDGNITDANEAFSNIIGYTRDDIRSGKIKWTDITPAEWQIADAAAVDALRHTGTALPYEKEFIHKTGARIQVLIGGAFLAGSKKSGVSCVVDLSARRRMEQALRESGERYRIVADTASDAIITFDQHYAITYANPAAEKIFGYSPRALCGQNLGLLMDLDLLELDIHKETRPRESDAGTPHGHWNRREIPALHKDGRKILLEMSLGEQHQVNQHSFTTIMRDITERKQSEVLCTRQNQILEMIATGKPLPEILEQLVKTIEFQCPGMLGSVLLIDEDGVHVQHGAAPHLPAQYNRAINGATIGPQVGSCGTAMYSGKPVIVTDIGTDPLWKDYRELALGFGLRACWSMPILSSQGKVLGSFAMYYRETRSPTPQDLRMADLASHIAGIAIERKRTEDYISHMAHHDALTGLPNRVMLQASLSQALARARRHKDSVAVVFIDLDNFKNINDSLGHHVGDVLLKAVAERLQHCLRQGDLVARLGGDEFVIILTTQPHSNEAALVAGKVLTILEPPFSTDGHAFYISGSIGISIYPTDGETVERLMQAADTAMYHAKEKGRGNYQFFTQNLNVAIQQRLSIEGQLRQALARGEMTLHYQPQMTMRDSHIFAAEALLRWRHPERGLVSPSDFIPIAEETGLILPIGEWVLRQACRQLQHWRAGGYPDLKIAVNLSTRQIFHLRLLDMIAQILEETKLPADALNLEITESILMQPSEENLLILNKLGDMGIRLSLDDFGTGYSNLSYLQQFPLHTLKIDRSFVHRIGQDRHGMTITATIIAMAKSLQLEVIAEGVETAEQASVLQAQGCVSAQGYYYSRPLAADVLTELMAH